MVLNSGISNLYRFSMSQWW